MAWLEVIYYEKCNDYVVNQGFPYWGAWGYPSHPLIFFDPPPLIKTNAPHWALPT